MKHIFPAIHFKIKKIRYIQILFFEKKIEKYVIVKEVHCKLCYNFSLCLEIAIEFMETWINQYSIVISPFTVNLTIRKKH